MTAVKPSTYPASRRRARPASAGEPADLEARSDAEVVAAVLAGVDGPERVLSWARAALARFDGIDGVLHATAAELATLPGSETQGHHGRLQAARELMLRALRERLARGPALSSPQAVGHFLQAQIARRPHEVFAALFLDAQHRLLAFEELFRGTLTQTAVYPREVVKRALAHNAAGVILAHNHPSGTTEPSHADELLTRTLAEALGIVDVRVVDHVIVARGACLSFAERGLL